MAPTRLFIICVVAEMETHYVAISQKFLERYDNNGLGLLCGRFLATNVVLIQSSKGAVTSLSLAMLSRSFSQWYVSLYYKDASHISLDMNVRKTKSFLASGLVRVMYLYYIYPHNNFLSPKSKKYYVHGYP